MINNYSLNYSIIHSGCGFQLPPPLLLILRGYIYGCIGCEPSVQSISVKSWFVLLAQVTGGVDPLPAAPFNLFIIILFINLWLLHIRKRAIGWSNNKFWMPGRPAFLHLSDQAMCLLPSDACLPAWGYLSISLTNVITQDFFLVIHFFFI
jgi:hypothetical protein